MLSVNHMRQSRNCPSASAIFLAGNPALVNAFTVGLSSSIAIHLNPADVAVARRKSGTNSAPSLGRSRHQKSPPGGSRGLSSEGADARNVCNGRSFTASARTLSNSPTNSVAGSRPSVTRQSAHFSRTRAVISLSLVLQVMPECSVIVEFLKS